jgi:hypothetical protein
MKMSAPLESELTVAFALAAGERLSPGVRPCGPAEVLGQGGQRRASRRRGIWAKGEIAAPCLGRAPGGASAVRPAGDQPEILRGRGRRGKAVSLIVDEQAAVEAFAHPDAAAGVGAAMRARGNLDQTGAEAHGVVPGHDPRVPAREGIGEIARRAAPGVSRSRTPSPCPA